MDGDRMKSLTTRINNLGVELAEMGNTMIALKYASKRMAEVMADVDDYLEWAEWQLKEEEMWTGAGIQNEEDAEYGIAIDGIDSYTWPDISPGDRMYYGGYVFSDDKTHYYSPPFFISGNSEIGDFVKCPLKEFE